MDSRAGDGFNSNFGYVPQSLRGRSMLRGYMTPYGAAGFGPNPYDRLRQRLLWRLQSPTTLRI